jgi:glycosyltransferase involved in cell wall biosynthesis
MRLDVLIATYNRCALLARALESLRRAPAPEDLDVYVTIIDNNSPDETRRVVEAAMPVFNGRLKYLFEPRQGRTHALNTGIQDVCERGGELIGIIDDDEEIDEKWYATVYRAFTEHDVDFIGGPYLPRWRVEPPRWLPPSYCAVIGWIDGGREVREYGKDYRGMLMGGNAVIRRQMFERVGLYNTNLGPNAKTGTQTGDDEDMYRRLIAARARGLYMPDLIIYHYIPPHRLTKAYYRRWCFENSTACGFLDRTQPQKNVAYLAGIPRYLFGNAARALLRLARASLNSQRDAAQFFEDELSVRYLVGFFYGKHFYHPASANEDEMMKGSNLVQTKTG